MRLGFSQNGMSKSWIGTCRNNRSNLSLYRKSVTISEAVAQSAVMSPPHKFRTSPASHSSSYKEMGELSPRRAPRVLVVDDNPDTMVLMRELLSTRGYEVIAVPDAARAEIEI